MKQLYLECLSGISGDMFVAALLDLGADENRLKEVLNTIPVKGFEIRISRVKKAGLDVCDFDVILDKKHENHDSDMDYLYGKKTEAETTGIHCHTAKPHSHEHSHEEQKGHAHSCHEEHHSHAQHQQHRGMKEVLDIINMTQMPEKARQLAIRIFTILGEAEAKAHGTTLEKVHFHEVGAVDSIVDIIAAAVCLDDLQVQEVIIPVLYEGTGKIRCQHGILPVPVPAVSNIISASHLTLHITQVEAELVTPTGAAIAAAIQTKTQLPKNFTIEKIGIGAGKRSYESPSLLRGMFIEEYTPKDTLEKEQKDLIYKLESNIDDCTGENLGYVMECLMEAGARDVNYMPVFMKKNRPAYQLNVICKKEDVEKLEKIMFAETTTIGIRKMAMERSVLKREICQLDTSLGMARVKVCQWEQGDETLQKVYPEYDSVIKICKNTGKNFQEVFQLIERAAYESLIQ